jgi:hypothetical protein
MVGQGITSHRDDPMPPAIPESDPMVNVAKISYHWIGLREHLQETMVFTIKYRAFL